MFDRVIKKNVVREPPWRSKLNVSFLRYSMALGRVVRPAPDTPFKLLYEKPEVNPLTQNYWEHTFDLQAHPGGVNPWLIELARVVVPEGYVGVLKSFEQVVEHEAIETPVHYSESGNWGRPFLIRDANVSLTWYFRLEHWTGFEPPQVNTVNPAPRDWPGVPHFEQPQMRDIWFPASSPASQNIHMTIGSGYLMRVLCLVELTAAYDLSISAKIRGFKMSAYNPSTLFAIRSVW